MTKADLEEPADLDVNDRNPHNHATMIIHALGSNESNDKG
jgi:hypothetical protein